MAITNKDRISRAIDALQEALPPYVTRELKASWGKNWDTRLDQSRNQPLSRDRKGAIVWDAQALLTTMLHNWKDVFGKQLGRAEQNYVGELIQVRNNLFAHATKPVSTDDAIRTLDTAERLCLAIGAANQADELKKLRIEAQRTVYAEESRSQTRSRTLTLEGEPQKGLKPWREIVTPHKDVASGRYQQAEFAADLAQVYKNEGADEYRNPVEFFRRTFLTEGLKHLLTGAMLRLNDKGGDPVVELQTNFGGGKTHSMLALYHLVGSENGLTLPGIEDLAKSAGVTKLPKCSRAVLVGTALSAGQIVKKDGIEIRTFWGEMAWQLGGKQAYALVAESDKNGASPGSDILAELLKRSAPCLILIDEWVAFVRQLYHVNDWPAGTFDANMTFVQALTEAARRVPGALVVASLPASQIEIGGEGGQAALDRLKNTFSRMESSWQPATADEGFEIVRRRLFEPLTEKDAFAARDAVVDHFSRMYRAGQGEFPSECGEGQYRRKMEAAYPIHPELFDRLYQDWGSLDKFQRTRGVLRLMAAVIHALWERQDASLMILPASIPIDATSVQSELTRYLEPGWSSVIGKDVDGPSSTPLAIDQEVPTLGRYSAVRRVARTIYLGSAPTYQGKNPGIDDKRIFLGCAQPGESVKSFGDALRRLADKATHLYQDGSRYWFSTQPSVARTAEDRAAAYKEPDIDVEIVKLLRRDKARGDFAGVHIAPDSSAEVPDEMEARLVILGPGHPYTKSDRGAAVKAAEGILNTRGNGQRIYRNMLVFFAPDAQRLAELRQAVRLWMAWSSVNNDRAALNLDEFQRKQAESKTNELKSTVDARVNETWVWALAPHQSDPKSRTVEWSGTRVNGQDTLAARVSKKLVQDEALMTRLGPQRLKIKLDEYVWSDLPHIETKKLWEYIASYLYMPRLRDRHVLLETIQTALNQLVCDAFAYAGRFDEAKSRYEGLRLTGGAAVDIDSFSVLVKPDIAHTQALADRPAEGKVLDVGTHAEDTRPTPPSPPNSRESAKPLPPRRFFGTVEIDADRASRDMGRIAEEVLQHLTTLPGSKVRVTVEISAEVPDGIPDDTQRTVRENGTALKFRSQGFESGS